mgnify:CR=1 FL=1
MNTTQNLTIPAGFRQVHEHDNGETFTTITGPSAGGVSTHVDARDSSVVVSVDGYDRDNNVGLDMSVATARRLHAQLGDVLNALG